MDKPPESTPERPPTIIQKFNAGTVLVREAERSRKMFIIRSGKVRVYKDYLGQKVTLAVLGEGEIFGELSFFDDEPRSASVETLTELEAIVVDGDLANQQIKALPDWILPVFKTVFHRFREADRKITVLQSMNEFQKRNFKTDSVGKMIYLELLRYNKALSIMYEQAVQVNEEVKTDALLKSMDEMLGSRFLGLNVYWNVMKEQNFIDHELDQRKGQVKINFDLMELFNAYLTSEVDKESFMILSHTALAVMRRIVGFTKASEQAEEVTEEEVMVTFRELQIKAMPLWQEGVEELTKKEVVSVSDAEQAFVIFPVDLYRLYTFQSVIKAFDHTIMSLD